MSKHTEVDPLLACLVIFTKIHHRPFSAEALTHGLPREEGESTPTLFSLYTSKSLFSRASQRAGFSSKLVQRPLNEISSLVLPAILLLQDGGACILEAVDKANAKAKIIIPEMPDSEEWITLEKLDSLYIGYSYFVKKEHRFEQHDKKVLNTDHKHWFWSSIKYSRSIYRDVIVASFVINLFVLAAPLFTMNVYDRVVPNNAIETMWVLAIGILVIYILDVILKLLRTYLLETAGKKSDIIISSILFEKVMNLKMAVRPKSVGSFANNLREFERIRNFFTSSTVSTLIDLPFALLFLMVAYYIGGLIILVPIAVIAVIIFYSFLVKEPLRKSIESTYEASAHKNGVLIESLMNLETIKVLGADGHSQWNWEESTGDIAHKGFRSKIFSASIQTVTSFMVQLNTVIVLIVGVYMIQAMELTMGGLIASVILTARIIAPMGQMAALLANYEQTKTAYTSLNAIMNLPVERPASKQFVYREHLTGKITFNNVVFSYPDEEKQTLNGISFTVNPGERVGIIGKIGSGKSTIQKLLLNLYEPDSGSILIDDIDISQIDPADLRRQISYVPQEVALFNTTLRANIVYKKPSAGNEALLKAAHIGLVSEFVNHHPQGYDMNIGEQGAGLSGGQKQAVGIARAFITETPMVILDEPSNAMDNGSEALLLKRLDEATKGKTTILVTHKTSMMALVERLIIIDNGKIVMDGTKEKVLEALKGGSNG
ncbi:MAG: type I secretion system permease/ATPase [Helicobacteraceae bacterium]|jgi:ATP-binding cassette subfamily C protein LapB|nr:type I secretion system permease/ATPase [Helicobacteraceae bacterium]